MKISKEKFKRMMKRGRSGARSLASGGKGTAIEAASGAASFYAGNMLDSSVQFAADKPWLKGVALVGVGHMLKKKGKLGAVGAALCGAGGYALGQWYKNKPKAATGTTTTSTPAAAPSQTQGIYGGNDGPWGPDTGLVFRSAAAAV